MSSTLQCFPALSFKPQFPLPKEDPLMALLQHQSSSLLLQKFLQSQSMDSGMYLSAPPTGLLPSLPPTLGCTGGGGAGAGALASVPLNLFLAGDSSERVLHQVHANHVTKRRNRTTFTHEQAAALEKEYSMDQYMPRSRRAAVAESLNLSESQVKTWFQNRRAKDKRTDKLIHATATASISAHHDFSPSTTAANSLHASPRTSLIPGSRAALDTKFLMPPSSTLSMGASPSPVSTVGSSPISPASPLMMGSPSNQAALAALYMQALHLQAAHTTNPCCSTAFLPPSTTN